MQITLKEQTREEQIKELRKHYYTEMRQKIRERNIYIQAIIQSYKNTVKELDKEQENIRQEKRRKKNL